MYPQKKQQTRERGSTENSLNRGTKGLSEGRKRKKLPVTDTIFNSPNQLSISYRHGQYPSHVTKFGKIHRNRPKYN